MTDSSFRTGLNAIFAAHSKQFPSADAIAVIWTRVSAKPDSFMAWAAKELMDYEKLPGNIGLELESVLYPRWLAQSGCNAGTRPCQDCDPTTPGFFTAWDKDPQGQPHRFIVRCVCNRNPQFARMAPMTKDHARRRQFSVLPPGERDSFRFEQTLMH